MSSESLIDALDESDGFGKGPASIALDRGSMRVIRGFYQSLQTPNKLGISCEYDDGVGCDAALDLTSRMITLNNSSYSAWTFRKKILTVAPSKVVLDEIEFVDEWCAKSPKNYQVWFHRRWLVDELLRRSLIRSEDLMVKECSALEELIEREPKHYHAWSHRMYISNRFALTTSVTEIEFSAKYIDLDVRNNSAWNYRRFALRAHQSLAINEIEFAVNKILLCPGNESPWVYLRSLEGWHQHSLVRKLFESHLFIHKRGSLHLRDAFDSYIFFLQLNGEHERCEDLIGELGIVDRNRERILLLRRNR
jgi:protein farnesyltransferase/geranylgeranyltransferase type-1 subunit alpha